MAWFIDQALSARYAYIYTPPYLHVFKYAPSFPVGVLEQPVSSQWRWTKCKANTIQYILTILVHNTFKANRSMHGCWCPGSLCRQVINSHDTDYVGQAAFYFQRGRKSTIMTSSTGNIFRVTGPLWGEFTGHRWIPLTKASDAELWCFLWSAPE